ncbi:hypothetical protein LIA77_10011 [Sarocladium implicatum]|nr:hypothetical protein LIA77_10011 [Sarocladium implicatum]
MDDGPRARHMPHGEESSFFLLLSSRQRQKIPGSSFGKMCNGNGNGMNARWSDIRLWWTWTRSVAPPQDSSQANDTCIVHGSETVNRETHRQRMMPMLSAPVSGKAQARLRQGTGVSVLERLASAVACTFVVVVGS